MFITLVINENPEKALFPLGVINITLGVIEQVDPEDIIKALERHQSGDWGDLCEEDKEENERALKMGYRIFSSYHDRHGTKFWIITEADRSLTTILLPEEY